MIVGILKEIKTEENRVSMTPAGVKVMRDNGQTLLVEKNAGSGSGFEDKAYVDAGAEIIKTATGEIAKKGWKKAMKDNPEIKKGANVVKGKITFRGVADAFGLKFESIDHIL